MFGKQSFPSLTSLPDAGITRCLRPANNLRPFSIICVSPISRIKFLRFLPKLYFFSVSVASLLSAPSLLPRKIIFQNLHVFSQLLGDILYESIQQLAAHSQLRLKTFCYIKDSIDMFSTFSRRILLVHVIL